jgi:hypothetical protein
MCLVVDSPLKDADGQFVFPNVAGCSVKEKAG